MQAIERRGSTSTSRTSTSRRHDEYIHALLEASTREPPLRLRDRDADVVGPDLRRHPPPGDVRAAARRRDRRGWGDRMIVGAPGPPSGARRTPAGSRARAGSCCRSRSLPAAATYGDPRPAVEAARRTCRSGSGSRASGCSPSSAATTCVVDEMPSRRYLVAPVRRRRAAAGARGRERTRRGRPSPSRRSTGSTCTPRRSWSTTSSSASARATRTGAGSSTTARSPPSPSPSSSRRPGRTPRCNLRTALWAEHLGLPPAMGRALLADPIAAFELFRRPTLIGNRMSPFEALGVTPELGFPERVQDLGEDARHVSA